MRAIKSLFVIFILRTVKVLNFINLCKKIKGSSLRMIFILADSLSNGYIEQEIIKSMIEDSKIIIPFKLFSFVSQFDLRLFSNSKNSKMQGPFIDSFLNCLRLSNILYISSEPTLTTLYI